VHDAAKSHGAGSMTPNPAFERTKALRLGSTLAWAASRSTHSLNDSFLFCSCHTLKSLNVSSWPLPDGQFQLLAITRRCSCQFEIDGEADIAQI